MNATVITGRDIPLAQCLIVAAAMELYAKTKMLPNRAYTPTRMLAFAEKVLGVRYKRTQMHEAALHLRTWARAHRSQVWGQGEQYVDPNLPSQRRND